MNNETNYSKHLESTIAFHGHWCPGLAIGIRAAQWALEEMGKSPDEEIVAVVETDMCGVDAIQHLVGCTFGKGNLIHKDYGKNAFTFYRRRDDKSARLVMHPNPYGEEMVRLRAIMDKSQEGGLSDEEEKDREEIRDRMAQFIMTVPFEQLFTVGPAPEPVPQKARILSSLICADCGDAVMESRVRHFQDRILCIPCFEAVEREG